MEWRTAPAYPAAEAGRLVGLHPARVRRWVTVRHQSPVVNRKTKTAASSYVSFFELIELLLVKQFLDHGISLQRIRTALSEAESIVGGGHLAQRVFFADGNEIFLRVQGKNNAIMHLLSGGQWAIATVIEELGKQIEFFGPPREYARLWYPRGQDGHIVINPIVSFGSPSLIGRGITTANIYDLFVAEGNNHQAVEDWWGITRSEAMAAVEFERSLEAQA